VVKFALFAGSPETWLPLTTYQASLARCLKRFSVVLSSTVTCSCVAVRTGVAGRRTGGDPDVLSRYVVQDGWPLLLTDFTASASGVTVDG